MRRVVVVGAGVVGLLTAMECVRLGAQVDLVDQSTIPSAVATSFDVHRVVRTLHRGDRRLTLALAGLPGDWAAIERRTGTDFFCRTGVLTAMPDGDVAANLALLTENGVPARAVPAGELAARYPHVRFATDDAAVFEPAAGTVLAVRALLAISRLLRAQDAVRLHGHSPVTRVDDSGVVHLATGTTLVGDGVVVAAGPWSRDLLPAPVAARLTLKRQTMLSYAPSGHRPAWSGSPAVLGLGGGHDAWLMPPVAGTPVRLSAASACRTVAEPAGGDTSARWRDHLVDRFRGVLTDFEPAAVTGATDSYYLTDESGAGPLLAELSGSVWTYGACGGMSFKFAPMVAGTLADRALGRTPRPTGLDFVDQPRQLARAEVK